MKVRVLPRAKEEVKRMADYANTRWNRRVGRNVLQNFRKNMALLAHQPWLGCLEPLLSDRARAYRSLVIHKHCKVVYFVDEEADTLVIADVWDTRREPKNLMQNL